MILSPDIGSYEYEDYTNFDHLICCTHPLFLYVGTLGIPAIDYYLVPDHLWSGASCALMKVPQTSAELDSMEAAGTILLLALFFIFTPLFYHAFMKRCLRVKV